MVETARVLATLADRTIVLTGALSPARFRGSDAEFNIGTAVGAVQSLPPGTYIAMNRRVWDPARVRTNVEANRFEAIDYGRGGLPRRRPLPTARLPHPGFQARGLGHHALVPRRVEYQLDVGLGDRRDHLQLAAYVVDQDLAHAATGRGQGHLHLDHPLALAQRTQHGLVDQAKVD